MTTIFCIIKPMVAFGCLTLRLRDSIPIMVRSKKIDGTHRASHRTYRCEIFLPEGGEDSGRKTRSKIEEGTHGSWNWEEVLKQNPETLARSSSKKEEEEEEVDRAAAALKADFERRQLALLENPTPEMCRIIAQIMEVRIQSKLLQKRTGSCHWRFRYILCDR